MHAGLISRNRKKSKSPRGDSDDGAWNLITHYTAGMTDTLMDGGELIEQLWQCLPPFRHTPLMRNDGMREKTSRWMQRAREKERVFQRRNVSKLFGNFWIREFKVSPYEVTRKMPNCRRSVL